MLDQPSLWDTPSAISSQVADSGRSHSGSPDGPTNGPCGPEAAHAPALARQAKARGLMTLVTSGRLGHDSSASAALQQSLESRLVARLDTAGSTLFKLTWRHKTTPLGRSYLERAASARRTSGSDCTSVPPAVGPIAAAPQMPLGSWSTPRKEDAESAGMRHSQGVADTLTAQTSLASWPTPNIEDCKQDNWTEKALAEAISKGEVPPSTSQRLRSFASLASWPTPMAGTPAQNGNNKAGNNDSSRKTVALAAWPNPCTPNGGRSISIEQMDATGKTLDGRKHTASLEHAVKFAGPVRLTAGGLVLTGSDAGMESSGQLNPALSRWLMGVPSAWDDFACMAMQSVSLRRRRSSKATSK